MPQRTDPIRQMVLVAMAGGYAISAERIRQLRADSEKQIATLKVVFWIAIGLFNLMLWYPFGVPAPMAMRLIIGAGAFLVAIIFPIVGIRRHQRYLAQLEDCSQGPKRRKTDEIGCRYIDLVKKQRRVFIRAEFDLLESRPADGVTRS